jgi:hypothetical protein
MKMNQDKSSKDRVSSIRGLNETEKLSLIFTQQRKLSEFQEQINVQRLKSPSTNS